LAKRKPAESLRHTEGAGEPGVLGPRGESKPGFVAQLFQREPDS
jgi:hypothetical protein